MKRKPDPIDAEFKLGERATSYDHWFRTEVEASLADTRPDIPHDEAMARIRSAIANAKRNHSP